LLFCGSSLLFPGPPASWIFWALTCVLVLIFGYVARKQIRERGEGGSGLAVAGIVLGWVDVGLWAIALIFRTLGAVSG
jgi:Domain of unknown function (DUF4190)